MRDWAWARVVVGTVALAAATAAYAGRFGTDLPFVDEWDLLPEMFGDRFRWAWLFEWHNEHKYPAGKLVWAAGLWATGWNFRTGMFVSVALLAAAALLLADAARAVRGHASTGDLFAAALLLHWGHGYNLLMGYQATFVLFALGLAGTTWAAARGRTAWGLGFAALALVGGGFGLAAAPGLGAGLAWLAWRTRRPAFALAAAGAVGYCVWVVAGLPMRTPLGAQSSWGTLGTAVVQYQMVGWGLPVVAPDAAAQRAARLASLGVLALAAAGVARLARTPERRTLAGVFAAVLLANLGVAAAVAWGRNSGLIDRMVTTGAAGLAVAWVVGQAAGRVPAWVGLLMAAVAYGTNVGPGYDYGLATWEANKRLRTDIAAGVPPVFLAGRHGGAAEAIVGERMAPALRLLRDAGVGRFRAVGPDPAYTVLPAGGPFPCLLVWDARPRLPEGPPPRVALTPPGRPVIGLRVAVEQHHAAVWQSLWLHWTDRAGARHAAEVYPLVVPGRATVAFPVPGDPAEAWLEPACPIWGLTLESAEWLVPTP